MLKGGRSQKGATPLKKKKGGGGTNSFTLSPGGGVQKVSDSQFPIL